MEGLVRNHVRLAVDAEVRRRLGLPGRTVRSTPMQKGDRTRRWTDDEIRSAVKKLTRGRKVSRGAYKALRAQKGTAYPHPDTVATRCPELFT